MNIKFKKIILYFFFFYISFCNGSVSNAFSKMIDFQFHGKNLGDLIQKICQIKGLNIMLPSGLEKIETIINFSTPTKIPLAEAEEYLLYFLSMAGYMLAMQGEILTVVKKTENTLTRSNLPLYVQVPPENLPDNPGYIRAIYFLNHLRVPVGGAGSDAIRKILLDIIPDVKGIIVDPRSNAIILIAPSYSIAAAMTIIYEIDNYGIADEIAVLPLRYTSVGIVSKLLEEVSNISKDNAVNSSINSPNSGSAYFSNAIKIIPENKTNALILLGKSDAINKMISFVKEFVDIPQESGNCTVHVCELKYLDARKLAPVLQAMVTGKNQASQSIRDNSTSSQFKFFDNVLVFAEEVAQAQTNQQDAASQTKVTMGGNRLIIAATSSDYNVLKEIIFQLDQPQNQVIIEIMVLDLTIDELNNFGAQTRLPNMIAKNSGIGMQSIMLPSSSNFIINDPSQGTSAITDSSLLTNKSTLNSDLLSSFQSSSTDGASASTASSLADNIARNGVIISVGEKFKNLGIASILQLQHGFSVRDVVASPHIITQNNTKAEIKNVQIRRGEGGLSTNNNQYTGASVVNIVPYSAALNIGITPRISGNENSTTNKKASVNLEINIDIEDFKQSIGASNAQFDKFNRGVKTNSNVNSGDLLVIGGLYKETLRQSVSKTPFLGNIPIIGAFFRRTEKIYEESNLVIIIRVTVGNDFLLDDLRSFTHNQIKYSQSLVEDSVFGKLKDSVTRIDFYNPFNRKGFLKEDKSEEKIKNLYSNYKK